LFRDFKFRERSAMHEIKQRGKEIKTIKIKNRNIQEVKQGTYLKAQKVKKDSIFKRI